MHRIDVSDPERRVIGDILREQAEQASGDTYLMAGDVRLSFGQVNQLVNSYSAGLTKLGVVRGDRVSLFMENSIEMVGVALAANKLGAVWAPVNTWYKGDWLAQTLTDAEPALLVVDDALVERVQELGEDRSPLTRALVLGRATATHDTSPVAERQIETLARACGLTS